MREHILDIAERFSFVRFSYDCSVYVAYLRELLQIPLAERVVHLADYYETMDHITDALFEGYCGGTVTEAEKTQIFRAIRDDWSDEAPGGLRAAMIAILNALQPLDGVSKWILEVAVRQADPEYAAYLRSCAACERAKPAV